MESSKGNANRQDNVKTNGNITKEEPREHEVVTLDEAEEGEILCGHLLHPSKNNCREILVQLGFNRNKVFDITDGDNLSGQLETFLVEDPSFSKLSKKSHLILQVFNPKFQTWVELENEDDLKDGSVVKALFLPVDICADVKNPETLKRKRKHSGSRSRSQRDPDDDDDDDDGSVSSDNSQYTEECNEEIIYEPLVKRRSAFQNQAVQRTQIATYGSRSESEVPCNSLQLCCKSSSPQALETVLGNELVLDRMVMKTQTPRLDIRLNQEPFLAEKMEWARYFAAMPVPFWKSVIFSHSTFFMVKNNYIHCSNKCCSDIKERSSTKSFWCAITHHGPHIIVPMESSLNSNILYKILHDGIIPLSLKLQAQTKGSLVLQYSYELQTQFLGKKIVKYLENNPIKLLEWPVFVSNINPMNAFWSAVEEKLQGIRVHSVNAMAKAVIETCLYDPDIKKTCRYLVEAIPRLIQYIVDEGNVARTRLW